jgi:hypothetical protein
MKIKITLFVLLLLSSIICNAQVNLFKHPMFVGIGTNFTPQFKLDVDGEAAANNFLFILIHNLLLIYYKLLPIYKVK